jgi:hypothetical protein
MPLFAPASSVIVGATETFGGFELKKFGSVTGCEAAWVEQAEQTAREKSVAAPIAFGAQVKAALIADGQTDKDAGAEATRLLNSLDDLTTEDQWDLLLKYGDAFQQILSVKQGEKLHITVAKYFIARRITAPWIEANRAELVGVIGAEIPIGVAVPNVEADTAWIAALVPYLPVETLLDAYEFYTNERDAWALKKYPATLEQAETKSESAETAKGPQTLGEESPRSSGGNPRTGKGSTTK